MESPWGTGRSDGMTKGQAFSAGVVAGVLAGMLLFLLILEAQVSRATPGHPAPLCVPPGAQH
jgi:hypothetical protein